MRNDFIVHAVEMDQLVTGDLEVCYIAKWEPSEHKLQLVDLSACICLPWPGAH